MTYKSTQARIIGIQPLNARIDHITLLPDEFISYEAGQYLDILLQDQRLSYSIANAPLNSGTYHLHVRKSSLFTQGITLTLELPFGNCTLAKLNPNNPILLIAGGTGFAPIHAMLEQLLAQHDTRPTTLYWVTRSPDDLYFKDALQNWKNEQRNFNFVLQFSTNHSNALSDIILSNHYTDINRIQIVLAGPFDMVYRLRDELVAHGIKTNQLFSDAFNFEK